MHRYIRPVPVIACLLLVCIGYFGLRSCSSCILNQKQIHIPELVNHRTKLPKLQGWKYTYSCPEVWPFYRKKEIVGFAILDRNGKFFLDWQAYEIAHPPVNVLVEWRNWDRFELVFVNIDYRSPKAPHDRKIIDKAPRTYFFIPYIFDPQENKFKLDKASKASNYFVKKIKAEFPTNWHIPIKTTIRYPYLLDK